MFDRNWNRLGVLVGVLGFLLACQPVWANDETEFPLPTVEKYAPQLVHIIEDLGRGQLENAIDRVSLHLFQPLPTEEDSPFAKNTRGHWMQQFGIFGKVKFDFETVDFVGAKQISSQAYRLGFVGNGSKGPIFFAFNVFQYEGQWTMRGLSFQGDWGPLLTESITNIDRFEEPYTYQLKTAPATAEGQRKAVSVR